VLIHKRVIARMVLAHKWVIVRIVLVHTRLIVRIVLPHNRSVCQDSVGLKRVIARIVLTNISGRLLV
jgi:hypothetical protein